MATNRAVATPPLVGASVGSTVPNDAVKVTTVPLCTGVPAASTTDAMRVADPLTGTVVVLTLSVIVDSVGASRGTLSQAVKEATASRIADKANRERDTDRTSKDNRRMGLAGQGCRADQPGQRGYAMAALLVGLSVMARDDGRGAARVEPRHAARAGRRADLAR